MWWKQLLYIIGNVLLGSWLQTIKRQMDLRRKSSINSNLQTHPLIINFCSCVAAICKATIGMTFVVPKTLAHFLQRNRINEQIVTFIVKEYAMTLRFFLETQWRLITLELCGGACKQETQKRVSSCHYLWVVTGCACSQETREPAWQFFVHHQFFFLTLMFLEMRFWKRKPSRWLVLVSLMP